MRVGLFRPLAPEVIGGGYTFEHEIFERLLECAPTSKHEFVVFEDLDGDKATGKTPSLKETPRKRPFSAKQLYAKLRSISRTANSVPRPTYPWENEWISNSLVRERIDFFVNASPEIAILDVPFLVIVWDLQHRLQPFFPEVGSGDEWQRRENFFSQVLKRAGYVVTATDTGKKPLNLTPLEAFALGCPVIAGDIPGAKQELGDAAMLVNPANEFEIAEALKSVHSDSAKREA